jgi:hypothetical protein
MSAARIPVNFSPDPSVRFVDEEVVRFLRQSGAIRGRNLSTRAILPIYRRACQIADSPMPCVAAWQEAFQESATMSVGVPGYGRRA